MSNTLVLLCANIIVVAVTGKGIADVKGMDGIVVCMMMFALTSDVWRLLLWLIVKPR